jgi:hypothetical protein
MAPTKENANTEQPPLKPAHEEEGVFFPIFQLAHIPNAVNPAKAGAQLFTQCIGLKLDASLRWQDGWRGLCHS